MVNEDRLLNFGLAILMVLLVVALAALIYVAATGGLDSTTRITIYLPSERAR